MASLTVTRPDLFPESQSVGIYAASRVISEQTPTGPPRGSAVTTASVTSGVLTFAGLADDTGYVIGYDTGGGVWRKVRARTPVAAATLLARRPTWKVRRQALGLS